jgi:hypothetical protein
MKINKSAPWFLETDTNPQKTTSIKEAKASGTGWNCADCHYVKKDPAGWAECGKSKLLCTGHVQERTLPEWCPLVDEVTRAMSTEPTCKDCEHLTHLDGCGHPQMMNTGPSPGPRYIGSKPEKTPRPQWCPFHIKAPKPWCVNCRHNKYEHSMGHHYCMKRLGGLSNITSWVKAKTSYPDWCPLRQTK